MCAATILMLSGSGYVQAQDVAGGPPKILQIVSEELKPTTSSAAHEKTEGAFLQALVSSKSKSRYLGMTSLTGAPRALFFSAYSSFGEWEEEVKGNSKLPGLDAAMDKAMAADGALLSGITMTAWSHRSDMSMNEQNLKGVRYLEISQYNLKPGHTGEWGELARLVMAGYKEGIPEASWTVYEQTYGGQGDSFLVIVTLKSAAEVDEHMAGGRKFAEALGPERMKKLEELTASSVESQQSNIFVFAPKISYPDQAMTDADPTFWKQPKVAPKK